MRPKTTSRDLPPKMIRRVRKSKTSDKQWTSYFYNGYDELGARKEIPLGTDLNAAKRKWAELECVEPPPDTSLMKHVFDQYEKDILPGKAYSTQKDNLDSMRQLRKVFNDAPIDAVTPHIIARYRDTRSAKVRANREIALLSHIFNMAREWGFTQKENPCRGVRKNKESPRDYYADEDVWAAVCAQAVPELKDLMDLAYLTGQRPADVLKMKTSDIRNGALEIRQGKTKKYLRIVLGADEKQSQLGAILERLLSNAQKMRVSALVTLPNGQPLNKGTLRLRFEAARANAVQKAASDGNVALSTRISNFQFRDIRAKAATEIADISDASKLLGHTEQEITKKVYRRLGEEVKPTR